MKLTELLALRTKDNRVADFSHMPTETIKDFIHLKMKKSLTGDEVQRLTEIHGDIRYKTVGRVLHVSQAPQGYDESAKEHVK